VSKIKVNRIENTSTTDGGVSIDTSGKVGIGSTSIDGMLHVKGASTHGSLILEAGGTSGLTNQMFIQGHNNAGNSIGEINFAETATNQGALLFYTNGGSLTEKARIDSSGRLLVGTSTSISNLYRATTSAVSPTLQIENATNNYNSGYSNINYSASGFAPVLTLGLSKSNTQGTNTVVASGDELGYIHFVGADGTNFRSAAWIKGEVDGTPGSGDMPGRLVFSTTASGASSPTQRMRITESGSIGFGNMNYLFPEADNAFSIGLSGYRWSAIWAANGTIQTSDEREKTNITDAQLGSEFIKTLRPVSYKWVEGGKVDTGERDEDNNYIYKSVPGTRTHWGFIAQEVKQAVDAAGVDFGGWVLTDKDDPDSQQALRYDQFIAPLTKALQEALAEIDVLKAKVAALEGV